MRPTFSIIVFTVLSGAGYGLWLVLGLGLVAWWPRCRVESGSAGTPLGGLCVYPGILEQMLLAGFIFVAIGLFSSVAHLGKPARAWRALSQWRSSWLSREGIAALLTFVPAILIAVSLNLAEWRIRTGTPHGAIDRLLDPAHALCPLGALLAAGAIATVFCTAEIYASLKPVRAWHNRFVPAGYLLLALYSGAVVLSALATLPQAWFAHEMPFLLVAIAVLAACGALLKTFYWRAIDRLAPLDAGHATGLAAQGRVAPFEAPHTEENYLTHEMGFVLARRHARKLRAIASFVAFALPATFALLALALPASRPLMWLAAASTFAGLFVERWLFFAEAKHAVIAFYGR
jgi:sulfite dehydrogenase (quinone) subunit SoeC